MNEATKKLVMYALLLVLLGVVASFFTPELLAMGIPERLVNALPAALIGAGMVYFAVQYPKAHKEQ